MKFNVKKFRESDFSVFAYSHIHLFSFMALISEKYMNQQKDYIIDFYITKNLEKDFPVQYFGDAAAVRGVARADERRRLPAVRHARHGGGRLTVSAVPPAQRRGLLHRPPWHGRSGGRRLL